MDVDMDHLRQIARTAVAIGSDSDGPYPTSDGAYAQGALAAFHKLVFETLAPVEPAAQAVYDAVADLGFTGQLTFGYSNGNGGSQRTQEGESFVGPYMKIRKKDGELHVLKIGVDHGLIGWIDGSA